ncbi:hypothetical protein ACWDTT_35245 [Streptosporangium sandarakinum]|uniref:hypothetical protein n=1 Tax=Streptosporangium nondiastaticum TaxID=35764 RepID=UPI0031FA0718
MFDGAALPAALGIEGDGPEELLVIGADPHRRGVPDPDEARHLEAVFGGVGLVPYLVDDASKAVHVYAITWAG